MFLLRRAVRREQQLKLLCAVASIAGGITMCYLFFQFSILLTIIGLAGTVLGIRYLFSFLAHRRADDSQLMHLLRHQPGQIVWVYSVVTQRLPFGLQVGSSCTLYFKLINGDEITVGLPPKRLKVVARLLNRLLPHASFGYSKDKEQWYLASPEILLRDWGAEEGE